jgi:hypothetical protein
MQGGKKKIKYAPQHLRRDYSNLVDEANKADEISPSRIPDMDRGELDALIKYFQPKVKWPLNMQKALFARSCQDIISGRPNHWTQLAAVVKLDDDKNVDGIRPMLSALDCDMSVKLKIYKQVVLTFYFNAAIEKGVDHVSDFAEAAKSLCKDLEAIDLVIASEELAQGVDILIRSCVCIATLGDPSWEHDLAEEHLSSQ